MAPCCPNDIGSAVIHRSAGTSFRLWNVFPRTSFRRRITVTMCCGGASCFGGDENDLKSMSSVRKCEPECKKITGSKKLSELLSLSDPPCADIDEEVTEDVKRKVEKMRRAVQKLQHDDGLGGATDVRMLTKEDSDSRTRLALLGAIPPLVALLDSEDIDSQIASLYALLNLGIGNDANKSAIVKAGGVEKMLNIVVESPNGHSKQPVIEAIIANFLSLSALDSNKPIIGSSGAIHILATTLKNVDGINIIISSQAKQDSLRALYNLSLSPLNIANIVESDLIPSLVSTIGDMELSERILSILSNVVSTAEGRKAISDSADAFPILVDVLNWTDSPECQEKALYVLMVMAHRSYRDRNAMFEAGIGSILLELTLLGSTLAQNRASRMLRSLKMDKGRGRGRGGEVGGSVSAPMARSLWTASAEEEEEKKRGRKEERRAVKNLVYQSLMNNMRRIVKRANLTVDFVHSDRLKVLSSSASSSMSLPF
ncbi:U-box domain-containing protein 14-like [Impatiens glandulifera]|uniref:U-box domain-containing protein 14-like n=1 Tax=Impatiens glandulifera TaxID=253017 RepID=UPI001FB1207C|nr:U-box domain-containing protein 14-like [Impatiens glandulifera]